MTALVTLAQGKAHLRVDHDDDDVDIQMRIDAASEFVIRYVKRDPPWDIDTIPADARVAVLLTLSWFYDARAAGAFDNPSIAMGYPPPAVSAILHRYRDPALA